MPPSPSKKQQVLQKIPSLSIVLEENPQLLDYIDVVKKNSIATIRFRKEFYDFLDNKIITIVARRQSVPILDESLLRRVKDFARPPQWKQLSYSGKIMLPTKQQHRFRLIDHIISVYNSIYRLKNQRRDLSPKIVGNRLLKACQQLAKTGLSMRQIQHLLDTLPVSPRPDIVEEIETCLLSTDRSEFLQKLLSSNVEIPMDYMKQLGYKKPVSS